MDRNAGLSVRNVPNIHHHRNRVHIRQADLNPEVVCVRNPAAAVVRNRGPVVPKSRSAVIVKVATNGIFPAALPAMCGVSVRDDLEMLRRFRLGRLAWLVVFVPMPLLVNGFAMAMGVRNGDKARKAQLDELIATKADKIQAIIASYNIPLLPITKEAVRDDD